MSFQLQKTFYPPFPQDDGKTSQEYKNRFCERLVDFNEHIGITNCQVNMVTYLLIGQEDKNPIFHCTFFVPFVYL